MRVAFKIFDRANEARDYEFKSIALKSAATAVVYVACTMSGINQNYVDQQVRMLCDISGVTLKKATRIITRIMNA